MKKAIATALFVVIFGAVSNDDYEIEQQENSHWCQMIEEGTWYAGQDEIARRCP